MFEDVPTLSPAVLSETTTDVLATKILLVVNPALREYKYKPGLPVAELVIAMNVAAAVPEVELETINYV